MKKRLLLALPVTLAFVLGRYWRDLPAGAAEGGGAGGAVAGNGDVNGSGALDIADAVYLLSFLFLGGPAPAPCSPRGAGLGLPDTGQTQCVVCSGQPCQGLLQVFLFSQDASLVTGCPNDANRFTVTANPNSEDIVTDNCTGLQWQRFTSETRFTWCQALDFCFDLRYAGRAGWRLPSVRELESIVDYGREFPAIDPVFRFGDGGGAGGNPNRFWTSTSDAGSLASSWVIDFDSGITLDRQSKTNTFLVRAVRGGF
jgi:hypothetical protein